MKKCETVLGTLSPIKISAAYTELDSSSPLNALDSHVHNECEIYLNLSGDVSFAVESSIYPLVPGSVIITRPLEYHHCIYHSDKLHRHYLLLIDPTGNERLFDRFYNRPVGKDNMLLLDSEGTARFAAACEVLADDHAGELEKYQSLFTLLSSLEGAVLPALPCLRTDDCIIKALGKINSALGDKLTVRSLAAACGVSVNTLERRFREAVSATPHEYIKKKRLAKAASLLMQGKTVTEAAEFSGFSDCSAFITLFRRSFGVTPLKFQRRAIPTYKNR